MTTLISLPNELISRICYYVHPDDVHSFSTVNRDIYWATKSNLAKHRAFQRQFGVLDVLDDNSSKPHTFQFSLNLFHNILLGSPVASFIRHVRTGHIEDEHAEYSYRGFCETGYSPLEISDWKLEEIDDGWGYNLNLPRLPTLCPMFIGEPRASEHEVIPAPCNDYVDFRGPLSHSYVDGHRAGTALNLHRLYERLRKGDQDLLRSLLLSCLPNLESLDYRNYWENLCFETTVFWAARGIFEENTKRIAFRNLRRVSITTVRDSRDDLRPLLAYFMSLPNIVTVSVSGVKGDPERYESYKYYKNPKNYDASKATELRLINHDMTPDNLEILLDGGKPLKTFCSITPEFSKPRYIQSIGRILLKNAQSSLEKLELSKPSKTGTATEWGPIFLDHFQSLKQVTIEYTYLACCTRGLGDPKLADVLPRALETLTLKTEGSTEVLFLNLKDMLTRKNERLPRLTELCLHAELGSSECMDLQKACREVGINLSIES